MPSNIELIKSSLNSKSGNARDQLLGVLVKTEPNEIVPLFLQLYKDLSEEVMGFGVITSLAFAMEENKEIYSELVKRIVSNNIPTGLTPTLQSFC